MSEFRPPVPADFAARDHRPHCMNCATRMELHRCLTDPGGEILQHVYECRRCRLMMTDRPGAGAMQRDRHA